MDHQQHGQEPLHPPIRHFCGSHEDIAGGLRALQDLPELALAAQRARSTAAATMALFDRVVREHHAEEEQELFVSVQRSCTEVREAERIRALVERLTQEHRAIERTWARLRPVVAAAAAGKAQEIPVDFEGEVRALVQAYQAHARLEEEAFLPLADAILARNANHMEALDLALHLRHAPAPKPAYL